MWSGYLMPHTQGSRASRRLLVLFLATTLAPAVGLGWLGWRMIQQDRALERQRVQEHRDHAADLGAAALQRMLAQIEEQLTNLSTLPPSLIAQSASKLGRLQDGAALLVFGQSGVLQHSGVPLAYYPVSPPAAEPQPAVFSPGETLEYQKRDPAAAVRLFRELAGSKDPAVRAGALMRLGRSCRKAGDLSGALKAFQELAMLGDTPLNGLPAELVAHQGSALLFEAAGRKGDLKREVLILSEGLRNGRWQLTRGHYLFAEEQTRHWLGADQGQPAEADRQALATAAEWVWNEWRGTGGQEENVRGRRTLRAHERSVLMLWRSSSERLVALLIGPRFLEAVWLGALDQIGKSQGVAFALTDAEGHRVLGQPEASHTRQSIRAASATQLPWTLHAVSTANGSGASEISGRTNLLLAGIAMMAVLVLAVGYFNSRAISREVTAARLQSDFVAAVSHEFRTPLTSMRQLSEMLVSGRVSSDERRGQFYKELLRESERLHRLVEALLNFGRIEAGESQFRFESLDPAGLVRNVVAEFQQEVSKHGYQIELAENGDASAIRGDRESLARVFWNLLDNAVKYSPDCRTVWVDLTRCEKRLRVRVRDEGWGIPAKEQQEIFHNFVRGAASKSASIQGTGIGLAMARRIVEAHGGEISLESAPGKGSTFAVWLPLAG